MTALMSLSGIGHRYDGVLALDGIDLQVRAGSFLAVLGPNGAGKSTLAQIMAGAIRPSRGQLQLDGQDVTGRRDPLVRDGVCLIPEGRRLFGQLSVQENLLLGAYHERAAVRRERLLRVCQLMPQAVRDGRDRAAATLSGGEQQMLVIGRALMAEPRLLLIDEPSLGLAPILTARVYHMLSALREGGVSVVVFEQLATYAMRHADEVAVIRQGSLSYRGTADASRTRDALHEGYLGN